MAKATSPSGALIGINSCYIEFPLIGKKVLNNLPDISDSKSVHYNAEGIIGRSTPLVTYSYSDTRQISIQFHLFVLNSVDVQSNLEFLRAIQSLAYPRTSTNFPYIPPPIVTFKCGDLLGDSPLCLILTQYSVKFDTAVAWAEINIDGQSDPENSSLLPYKMDIDTSWWVVYTSDDLPDSDRIIQNGR